MKYRDIIIVAAAFAGLATTVYGISLVTVPYSFTAGSKAESSKVNSNFNTLETGANAAIGAINDAAGTKLTLAERLAVNMNDDGTFRNFSGMTIGSQWINPAITQTYSTASKFVITGQNMTDTYVSYRRLKIFLASSTVYSEVATSAYNAGDTLVTIADAVLTSPIVKIEHSLISPTGSADSAMSERLATGMIATSANTANMPVKRNGFGNFSTGTVTATWFKGNVFGNLSGTANYAKSIAIGGASNVPTTDAATGLRLIRGICSANGDGYTVSFTTTTKTRVTFATAFTAAPVATATGLYGAIYRSSTAYVSTPTTTYVDITGNDEGGTAMDCSFVVIGK